MHASMTELLDQLKPGFLWVGVDGTVRYANRSGTRQTGIGTGRRLQHGELARAVAAAAVTQEPHPVVLQLVGNAPGQAGTLECRVIPGLEGDDAFVIVAHGQEGVSGSGFETLMHSVRSDLRDPLRAACAALEVARGARSDGDALELDALLDRVDSLLRRTDKLVGLATLWDSDVLAADDRIEVWPLLQRVWAEVEPLAIERSVRVRFQSSIDTAELATFYGSEHWIRRVFVECLEGAVRCAPLGSVLDVHHEQMGARAGIVLRDTMLFAEQPHRADVIGHKLCSHVLALHGGQLRDEYEGPIRHLVLELPTGAPHHNDESGLALAQAQRYASDLAAVMNRARRAGRNQAADTV